MVNWSDLPVDVLREIVLKLDSAQDLVFFSAVCGPWKYAYSTAKNNWTRTMPWLMVPENAQNSPNYPRILYCPNKQRCYQLHLPQTYGARCWGSSCGWIVVLDHNLEMYMLNPITKSRISLPPLSSMPNVCVEDEDGPEFLQLCIIQKAVVIEADGEYIVITTPGIFYHSVHYARPGDQEKLG
ncbi:F-box protein At1g10110-like [Chenopodium quinoa]|uniref:F-box protein At1g10110-like n=1 Tax=Chenopodium quinoa TaxID=63459 RepID=UPI000B76D89D|nr:F-box protein At1g10110-like [Chenopodium quinoa]